LSAEERLMTLIDDPWLLGTARERIGAFVPWLDLPNVAPVSFEELVGTAGGGDDQSQLRAIWSLQLKLHIPGNPRAFGNAVFDRSSPTFNEGQIGAYRKHFSAAAYQSFNRQAVDLMERFGYTADAGDLAVPPDRGLPRHRQRYLKRPLRMMAADFSQTPILIEQGVLGHNLVKLGGRYAVIPHSLGPVDLRAADRPLPEGIHWFDHLDEAHAWLTCSILPPPAAIAIEDAESAPAAVPLLLIESLWGRNFVKYGQRFFALRQTDGPVDVVVLAEQMDNGQAGALASCVHESLLAALVASARELEAEQQVVPVDNAVVEPVQPELLAGLCEHVGRQQLAIAEMRAEIIHLKQTLWSNLRPKLRGTASGHGKREEEERAA
jgi:hypothetical protein